MSDSGRTSLRTYRDSFQGLGCRAGCMIHLALLGLLGIAMLVWAVKIRAWELRVTLELPAAPEPPPAAEPQEQPPAP